MSKNVALIGSSGSHLFHLGGKDPHSLIAEVATQLRSANIKLTQVVFVESSTRIDRASENTQAKLWGIDNDFPHILLESRLEEVNQRAIQESESLAQEIRNGQISGLIMVSADPKGINESVIEAAIEKNLPLVGTGGTAVATALNMGARVISFSGTTGTSNHSRAVSFTSALAKEWKLDFSPVTDSTQVRFRELSNIFSELGFVTNALIPAVISIALLTAVIESTGWESLQIHEFKQTIFSVFASVIVARRIAGKNDVIIGAAILAGILSNQGGIIGGSLTGILVGTFVHYSVQYLARANVPTTAIQIFSGGFVGILAGVIGNYLMTPISLTIGGAILSILDLAFQFSGVLMGGVLGLLIWPALISGRYHSIVLPIMLIEIEAQGNSFLGAIDMTCLIMVTAGILLANIILPRNEKRDSQLYRSLVVNLALGDFAEASYPYMFSDRRVMISALIAGALGGAAIGLFQSRGVGYLPIFIAPLISNHPFGFIISMVIAFGASCVLTLAINIFERRKINKEIV